MHKMRALKSCLVLASAVLLITPTANGVYDLPDGSCPDDCRRIDWDAGLDPEGGIPDYPVGITMNTTDTGHEYYCDPSGVVDCASNLQKALDNCSANHAVYLPTGSFGISATLDLPSYVALRGAGSDVTTIKLTGGNGLRFDGTKNYGSEIDMTEDPAKGDTQFVLAHTNGLSVNDWISIFQDNDPSIPVSINGNGSNCFWCGEDNGQHTMQQFARITAISGTTISVNRPLYYDYNDAANDAAVKRVNFGIVKAGIEDLKIDGSGVNGSLITAWHARHSWIRAVETYMAGDSSGDAHLAMYWCHGIELRDSYLHHGKGNGSGQNYIYALYWNSDHKIENNIIESLRHMTFEGGGSGCAVLYNYLVNNWEAEDDTYLSADLNPNHGPHPHMNLFEGNISSKFTADQTMGSSSHSVAFRNWIQGHRATPDVHWGVWAVDLQKHNRYYSLVGNVIGMPDWTSGTVTADGDCEPEEPTVYRFGCDGQPGGYADSLVGTTTLRHGNYDYITGGVVNWDGGTDDVLRASMYYDSRPSWFDDQGAGRPWPPIGPDIEGLVNDIPAKDRYEGELYVREGAPAPPQNLRVNVRN